jgi:hypothetical protein
MANQWFFARDGATSGPFSATQLQELAAAGQIRPQDTVWKEGMERRVSAAKVDKLFAAPVPALSAVPAGLAAPAAARPSPSRRPSPQPAALVADSSPPADPTSLAERLASVEDLELAPGTAVWEGPPAAPDKSPEEQASQAKKPPPPQKPKNMRVLGVKGGVISGQDGKVVKYRKQCLRCSYLDSSMTTTPIRSGTTRVNFFCPKCRKNQQTEIMGVG